MTAQTVTLPDLTNGTVGEAMSPGVIACHPLSPLRVVARMMAAHRVHAVVVFGGEPPARPWGVVSDLDLVGALGTRANAGAVAASPVVTVEPSDTLQHAAQLLRDNRTAHLIVVDPDSKLPIGVLSTLDIAKAVAVEQGADEPVDGF